MPETIVRRRFLAGAIASTGALALPACQSYGPYGGIDFVEVVRRLLLASSQRAFYRLTAPGGFWDQQVAQVGLDGYFGNRGNVLARILTSALFKSRLEGAVARIAVDASYRAAPLITDSIRTIGFSNAVDLLRGGPTAATVFLQAQIGPRLIDMLVPGVGNALRIAQDPLISELIAGTTGVDVGGIASSLSYRVADAIWGEMGREEAAIRADPRSTNDRVLMEGLGGGAR